MEAGLVRSLEGVLQGAGTGSFAAPSFTGGPSLVSTLVGPAVEAGQLYGTLNDELLQEARGACPIRDAFVSSLRGEVDGYVRALAALDAELRDPASTAALRRLAVWAEDRCAALRTVKCLYEACCGLSGGAVVSACWAFSKHGDPRTSAPARRALRAALRPMVAAAVCWMLLGDAPEPRDGRLSSGGSGLPSTCLWLGPDAVAHARGVAAGCVDVAAVPPCVPPALAKRVADTGAATHFLRYACSDTVWLKALSAQHASTLVLMTPGSGAGRGQGGGDGDPEERLGAHPPAVRLLQELVHAVKPAVDARVRHVLCSVHRLPVHLRALRRYVLLGQGDFATALVQGVDCSSSGGGGGLRDTPSAAMVGRKAQLAGLLEAALRSSNGALDEEDVTGRLALPGGGGATPTSPAAASVQVVYAVTAPVSAVLTPASAVHYARVFSFLWTLKRAEHVACTLWAGHMSAYHALASLGHPGLSALLHTCHTVRADMTHSVTALSAFAQCDVLSPAFTRLEAGVAEATGLPSLRAAHDTFVADITRGCFLDETGRGGVGACIRGLTETVLRFAALQDALYAGAGGLLTRPGGGADTLPRQARGGRRPPSAARQPLEPGEEAELTAVLRPYAAPLREASGAYASHLASLLSALHGPGGAGGLLAASLVTRLNFNAGAM